MLVVLKESIFSLMRASSVHISHNSSYYLYIYNFFFYIFPLFIHYLYFKRFWRVFQSNPTQQITNHPFRKAELIFSLYLQLTLCFIYHICISRGFFFPWCIILFYRCNFPDVLSLTKKEKKNYYLSSLCSRQINSKNQRMSFLLFIRFYA